jgi:tropomyosin
MDVDLEKAEGKLADAKNAREEGDHSRAALDNLVRKVQLLEDELDQAEKNVKETVEK